MQQLYTQAFGFSGVVNITDTVERTGAFCVINVYEDAAIESITSAHLEGNTLAGIILSKGTVLYFPFEAIKLTSGKVLVHRTVRTFGDHIKY